ncbi:MAG: hypothetical protein II192_06590, partial [Clostridia bacterium]|nr:hypothetical protein [Clostridia bacterium]
PQDFSVTKITSFIAANDHSIIILPRFLSVFNRFPKSLKKKGGGSIRSLPFSAFLFCEPLCFDTKLRDLCVFVSL